MGEFGRPIDDAFALLPPPQKRQALADMDAEIIERTESIKNALVRINVLAPIQLGLVVIVLTLLSQKNPLDKRWLAVGLGFELLGLAASMVALMPKLENMLPGLDYTNEFAAKAVKQDPKRRFRSRRLKVNRRSNLLAQKRREVLVAILFSLAGILASGIAGVILAARLWGVWAVVSAAVLFVGVVLVILRGVRNTFRQRKAKKEVG